MLVKELEEIYDVVDRGRAQFPTVSRAIAGPRWLVKTSAMEAADRRIAVTVKLTVGESELGVVRRCLGRG